MPGLPRPLPERGKLKALYRWLNQLREYVYSLRPLQSHNTLTEVTAAGVYRHSRGGGTGEDGADGELEFEGQWNPATTYTVGDRVIDGDDSAEGKEAHDTGDRAGLYRCIAGIVGDGANDPPSVDTAHWEMEDNDHHPKRRWIVPGQDGFIEVDSGRDDEDNLWLKIQVNGVATQGAFILYMQDLLDAASDGGITTGEGMVLRARLTQGRDESTGDCKQCIMLRGEWEDV